MDACNFHLRLEHSAAAVLGSAIGSFNSSEIDLGFSGEIKGSSGLDISWLDALTYRVF